LVKRVPDFCFQLLIYRSVYCLLSVCSMFIIAAAIIKITLNVVSLVVVIERAEKRCHDCSSEIGVW